MTTKVPSVPQPTGDNADYCLSNVKMLLDVREGRAGDRLDKNVTFRELATLGVVVDPTGSVSASTNAARAANLPVTSGTVVTGGYDPVLDLTSPPSPGNLVATSGIGVVFLGWDQPTYPNHSFAEVWRSEIDDIGSATLVGQSNSQNFLDRPTSVQVRYFYWVRFVSQANVKGPYTGESASAVADIDPALIISKIEGQILESSLSRSLATRIQRIEGDVNTVSSIQNSVATLNTSVTQSITTVNATIGSLSSTIQQEITARVSGDSSLAQSITTVSSTVNNLSSSVQAETTARINADNSLFAQYTVKIDNNGHVSGFGLASETVNGTTTSAFIIRADRFAVVDPSSTSNNLTNAPSSDSVPFAVVDGVVYLKDAQIRDGSITNAKIVSLTANKITAGYINASIGLNGASVYGAELYAGGTVTVSTDANGNVTGFTPNNPTIKVANGTAEFVAANFLIKSSASDASSQGVFQVVNGRVEIQNAVIGEGKITVANIVNEIKSAGYSPGSTGWKIDTATGVAEFQDVTLRGVMQSTDGQFVINTSTKVISISV
jgi:hypothetical protein